MTRRFRASGLGFAACVTLVASTGCQLFRPDSEPIERNVKRLMDGVIAPAIAEALADTSARTAQLQGQGSLINPGYHVAGKIGMFNGIEYDLTIRLVGVSGNLAGAGQADAGQAGPGGAGDGGSGDGGQ